MYSRIIFTKQKQNTNTHTYIHIATYSRIVLVGSKCTSLTTSGLQWNLQNAPSSFGELVSSSNHVVSDIVNITTSDPIIWTTELLNPPE